MRRLDRECRNLQQITADSLIGFNELLLRTLVARRKACHSLRAWPRPLDTDAPHKMNTAPARRQVLAWAEISLAIGSVTSILGMPIIVGALQDGWGFTAEYAGYVTSIDLAGVLTGSVVTSLLARRVDWRCYVGAALVLSAAFNFLCAPFHSLVALCCLRFAAGVASGATYASSLTLLSRNPDPAHGFSMLILLQVLANAVVLALFPLLNVRWGPAGIFVAIAGVLMASLAVVPLLPRRDSVAKAQISARATQHRRHFAVPLLPALCLTAVALFYVTIGSYWAYAERMGIGFGISMEEVHWLLSAGVLLSAAACLSARAVAHRIGQSRPLLFALAMLATTLLIHGMMPTPTMFVITLAILQLCWNFIDIFQLGTLAVLDPSGRAAALVPAAQGAALAAGPAAAGFVLRLGKGYTAVLLLAGFMSALAAVIYAVVHRRYRSESAALRIAF
jgi:predicted MFS family arabinose efflux permease